MLGALCSLPRMGAETLFMQLALVYLVLFGPCVACDCSDRYRCYKRPTDIKQGTFQDVQFAMCCSGLAFANLICLEMLWRSARDWRKMELYPL